MGCGIITRDQNIIKYHSLNPRRTFRTPRSLLKLRWNNILPRKLFSVRKLSVDLEGMPFLKGIISDQWDIERLALLLWWDKSQRNERKNGYELLPPANRWQHHKDMDSDGSRAEEITRRVWVGKWSSGSFHIVLSGRIDSKYGQGYDFSALPVFLAQVG